MAERPITEVVDFLFVRIARDEQIAQRCTPGPWQWKDPGGKVNHDATHITRHNPARTLAEVAAERRILDAYRDAVARRDYYARDGEEPFVSESRGFVEALEMVIRRLAEVYQAEERTDD